MKIARNLTNDRMIGKAGINGIRRRGRHRFLKKGRQRFFFLSWYAINDQKSTPGKKMNVDTKLPQNGSSS